MIDASAFWKKNPTKRERLKHFAMLAIGKAETGDDWPLVRDSLLIVSCLVI